MRISKDEPQTREQMELRLQAFCEEYILRCEECGDTRVVRGLPIAEAVRMLIIYQEKHYG